MHANTPILERFINEDFGLVGKDTSRWAKSDVHSSLVLDKERGIFFFNSREIVGDPLTYLTRVRGMSFRDSREYLKQFKDYQGTYVYTISNPNEDQDVVVYPGLVDVFYEFGNAYDNRDYWYRRGISDQTIDKFQLGWYNGYSTVPIFTGGVFRNFQMRRDRPDKRIKGYYKNVGPLIFNSDILKFVKTAFIAEGLTDCLKANQEGIPCVSHNTGAGGWVDEWFKYFFPVKEIYAIFDNDKAGREGAKKVCKSLGIYKTKVYTFDGQDDGYDIVRFFQDGGTKDQLLSLVEDQSKYLFELK